jgi:hypothetical protein
MALASTSAGRLSRQLLRSVRTYMQRPALERNRLARALGGGHRQNERQASPARVRARAACLAARRARELSGAACAGAALLRRQFRGRVPTAAAADLAQHGVADLVCSLIHCVRILANPLR